MTISVPFLRVDLGTKGAEEKLILKPVDTSQAGTGGAWDNVKE